MIVDDGGAGCRLVRFGVTRRIISEHSARSEHKGDDADDHRRVTGLTCFGVVSHNIFLQGGFVGGPAECRFCAPFSL